MRRPTHNTTKLPKALLEQIGGQAGELGARSAKSKQKRPLARRERRRAARDQKKGKQRPNRAQSHRQEDPDDSDSEEEEIPQQRPSHQTKTKTAKDDSKPLKSTLKHKEQSERSSITKKDEPSGISKPSLSQGVIDRLAADDAEIVALEKALGIKSKNRVPKSFEDDGLDMLLGDLDDSTPEAQTRQGKRRRTEEDEWLERKRRKAQGLQDNEQIDSAGSEEEVYNDFSGSEGDDEVNTESSHELENEGTGSGQDEFSGFESETSSPPKSKKRVRENPYVAPLTTNDGTATKYVPPSLRKPASSDTEAMLRLRRQTQGLLNRLSEANMLFILADVEKLYRDHPRQHVTSTIVDIILSVICDRGMLQDTHIILHAGFVVSIYKTIGTDFGAQVVQRLVESFTRFYELDGEGNGKETSNIVSMLAELYNFQMIGSALIFDYVRMFLRELSEVNTELLLKIIRISGPQLRQEDPASLKDIVLLLQPAIAKAGEANLSIRTKFMVETINNLKNNRMKTGAAASAITSEHTIRMKKALGTLNTRSLKSTEPLRLGLDDIRHADKRGKWWLVGPSWKEHGEIGEEKLNGDTRGDVYKAEDDGQEFGNASANLIQLAKDQRMNTDVRRAIFITIMSASDYSDAHLRLLKLHLKKSQELEMPRVLIQCAGAEQTYNPFYTLISRRLCSDHKLKMAFQFALWDLFKRMGENGEDGEVGAEEDDDPEAMSMRKIVNLARMFGVLVAERGLGLGVLKTLNLAYLQPKTQIFVEILLITVILHGQRGSETKRDEKPLMETFMRIKDTPQVVRGLQYFLKTVVSKTDIAGGRAEKETVRWACKVAGDALSVIASEKISDE